ncbi:MAG: hypothetical protein WBH47_12820 [Streptosporangiaceae bacterium]
MLAGQLSRPADGGEDLAVLDLDDRPDDGQQGQGREARHDQQHEPDDYRYGNQQVGGDEPPPGQRPRHLQHRARRLALLGRTDQPAGETGQQHGAEHADASRSERRADR